MSDLGWRTTDKLDELIFLKLGLDLTRKETQYPLVPVKDLKEFRQGTLALMEKTITAEIIAELESVIEGVDEDDGVSVAYIKDRINHYKAKETQL